MDRTRQQRGEGGGHTSACCTMHKKTPAAALINLSSVPRTSTSLLRACPHPAGTLRGNPSIQRVVHVLWMTLSTAGHSARQPHSSLQHGCAQPFPPLPPICTPPLALAPSASYNKPFASHTHTLAPSLGDPLSPRSNPFSFKVKPAGSKLLALRATTPALPPGPNPPAPTPLLHAPVLSAWSSPALLHRLPLVLHPMLLLPRLPLAVAAAMTGASAQESGAK